jgi:hypothetical protein
MDPAPGRHAKEEKDVKTQMPIFNRVPMGKISYASPPPGQKLAPRGDGPLFVTLI